MDFQSGKKQNIYTSEGGFFLHLKHHVVCTEDNALYPMFSPSSHYISSVFLRHPALLSLAPLTLPSVIKRFVIWAKCGSLPTPACCDLSSLLPRTCTLEAGSIGADSTHKAEVTGRDCEKGERDLWRIQFKTSLRLWLS